MEKYIDIIVHCSLQTILQKDRSSVSSEPKTYSTVNKYISTVSRYKV